MSAFEGSCEQISKPSLKERGDASNEEEPDSPSWGPDAYSWSFSHWTGVEAIIDDMLDIFGHSNLSHDPVFISIDAGELTNMSI